MITQLREITFISRNSDLFDNHYLPTCHYEPDRVINRDTEFLDISVTNTFLDSNFQKFSWLFKQSLKYKYKSWKYANMFIVAIPTIVKL